MDNDSALLAALAVIQARGAIGEHSLPDAVAHADRFVDLIPDGPRRLVDLGSGGGLPALVIATRRVDVSVTMVERRAARADLLRRAVISLRMGDRCTVLAEDVALVYGRLPHSFEVATARSFADVPITLACIDNLLGQGGVGLVSEPPADRTDVWATALGSHPHISDMGVYQGIRLLARC